MKFQKIIFIISIIIILLLLLLAQNTKQTQTGIIKSIKFSSNKITIQLENLEENLILFNANNLDLKKGDQISFQGKHNLYKNEKQITIDKIFIQHHDNS